MAVNNTLLTTDLIAKSALAEFATASPWLATAAKNYQQDFTSSGYKIGDTLRVRRRNQFVVGDGSVATSQAILQEVENLQIDHQYHAMIEYSIKDLTLSIDNFAQEFIQPAIQNIKAKMERDIGLAAAQALYYFSGSSASALNSFAAVDQAGTKMMEQGIDLGKDCYMALGLRDASALKAALLAGFTPMLNDEIARQSALGHLSYFDMFQSQNVAKHTAGAGPVTYSGDTLLVNGAVSSGSSIVMDGATVSITDYFKAGDVISIAGVQSVDPLSRESTGQDAQFVVTANASSDGSGNITVSVSPEINVDTSSPRQNFNNAVPNNAVVSMVGSHNVGTAYVSQALSLVCPPLEVLQVQKCSRAMDPDSGLALSITEQGDIGSYQNQMRLDVLCGFKWHPQYAVRVVSSL